MAGPEYNRFWSRELYSPLDKASNLPNAPTESKSSLSSIPKNPRLESKHLSLDYVEYQTSPLQPELTLDNLSEADFPCSIKGCPPDPQGESYVLGKDDFIWNEALSINGKKLWPLLLSPNSIDFLKWIAAQEGWDLESAIAEISNHGVLEECEPGYFRIIRRKL